MFKLTSHKNYIVFKITAWLFLIFFMLFNLQVCFASEVYQNQAKAKYLGISSDFGLWKDGVVKYVYNPTNAPSPFTDSAATLQLLQESMAEWEGACGIDFQAQGTGIDSSKNLGDSSDGIVVIGWNAISSAGQAGPSWGGVESLVFTPNGYWPYNDGDMELSTTNNWDKGSTEFSNNNLKGVVTHELGHLIGLGHSNNPNSIMYAGPYNFLNHLRTDDIDAGQGLYGQSASPSQVAVYSPPASASSNPFSEVGLSIYENVRVNNPPPITSSSSDNDWLWLSLEFSGNTSPSITPTIIATDPSGYIYSEAVDTYTCGSNSICSRYLTIGQISTLKTIPGTWKYYIIVNNQTVSQGTFDVNTTPSWNRAPTATVQYSVTSGTSPLNITATVNATDTESDTINLVWHIPGVGEVTEAKSSTTKSLSFTSIGNHLVFLEVNDNATHYTASQAGYSTAGSGFGRVYRQEFVVSNNTAPTANAGTDQSVTPGTLVTLDGSASSDPDNNTLTYSWSLTSKPNGSALQTGTASISQTVNTANTAAITPDVAGSYVVTLTVNDGTVDSASDSMAITVNSLPVASASASSNSVATGTLVTMNGTASSDADNDTLTYSWSFVAAGGASDSLSSTTVAQPTFTPTCAGTYVVSLTVNDGKQNSASPSSVSITVTGNTCATLDVDGDGDGDANDGLMVQRRLNSAGTVDTGVVLPTGVGGSGTSGARTNAEILSVIDDSGTAYDVDGDGDIDANDGLMIQRRLNSAGTVDTGVVLPTGVGGSGTSGARTNTEITTVIDALIP